ncbi:copper amine oxidase N-terminal domain-containing protein [Paenibacillus filicis]|uniref:Copper amine oxidase N-terminal domain-containing protein n=1 Tax=Paenibacillus gyeongsangnamensis TaxID=3388067 RepID=A0ABT4QGH5_9BACL|nr:copper amine oxidase N-terminal domain-containing protein [Paenibacillus filicis]MCZ8515966.1 copper amine oxidase N-terminal domain-containing protein [Paenibacillus filicis]
MNKRLTKWFILASVLGVLGHSTGSSAAAAAEAPKETELMLYFNQQDAYLNGSEIKLEAAPLRKDGKAYLPAAELGRLLGFPVRWDEVKRAVQVTAPAAFLEFNIPQNKVYVNGASTPWNQAALLWNDRLYIDSEWLNRFAGYKIRLDEKRGVIELRYLQAPDGGLFRNDTLPNMKPIAKFALDKPVYKLGEPIRYTDLSYSPDGDAITGREWTGNAEAIFTPGLYKVTLQVKDSRGNVSEPFSTNVEVSDEKLWDPFEYHVAHDPVGTYVKEEEAVLRKYLRGLPQLKKQETRPEDRSLIVSDSPESFKEKGFLYQEKVNGKARLYADHVNDTVRKMKLGIVVRNPSPDKTVTIKTTRKGEVYPSIYANLIGNEATIEFLQGDPVKTAETMTLRPYETAYYRTMPDFYPGQGMNVIYDVETDGDAYFSFAAMEQGDGLDSLPMYPQLPYSGNVRGTFSVSDIVWNIDASGVKKPSSFAIGDGTSDSFVTGKDFFKNEASLNLGNYGVEYRIHLDHPPKMAVLLLPRGGVFKGPFLVDGRIVQTPPSGVMMDYQGYTILARTEGNEAGVDIAFSPAAGSAFPVDVILYPLP